jgi:hypothetical protein
MRLLLISVLALVTALPLNAQRPFLSSLQATKDSPLFTTYAAAMERSEFTLDEGYHLSYYDTSRGIEFTTDNAGDWGLAFRRGSRLVVGLNELARQPVVTVSYSDMVRYSYAPFEDVEAKATFVVASSQLAVQEIILTNTGRSNVQLDLIPFLRNRGRAFNEVRLLKDLNAIAFTHEEFPDSWVLDHGVPYVPVVHDLFTFSEPVDRLVSFMSYQWGAVEIPPAIELNRAPAFVVWGRMTHGGGERCLHAAVAMTVMVKNDPARVLTESAPRWGSTVGFSSTAALYGFDVANFGPVRQGDSITVILRCNATGETAAIATAVGDTSKEHDRRIDAQFRRVEGPAPPAGVRRDIWGSGTELRLYWKPTPGLRYAVYRRDYRLAGTYERVAGPSEHPFYTEKNIADDKIYGFVVVSVDAHDRMSGHSNEVNNIEGSDFLTDTRYAGQVKSDARDLVKVLGAWKRIELAPGQSRSFRVVRGVRRPESSPEMLLSQADYLIGADLNVFQAANEKLYSAIPPLPGADPEPQLLYWSAFSLMRQVMLPPEGKCTFNYYVFSREPQWGWGHGGQVFHESLTMLAYGLMDPVSAMNSQRVYRERQWEDGYILYRTGPYLDESILYEGQYTTSAPWYAWQNWEVYRLTKDRKFLEEMYLSSTKLYDFYVSRRDRDGDGLCEWGGHAVLESVRDARVAVWDEVGWPSNFEGIDLNAMLVSEEKSLAAMARELGKNSEAASWDERARTRTGLINGSMWDESTGFYYNVDRSDNDFSFKAPNDLKRREIIGFLPLWAGIADSMQAATLVRTLLDSSMFWRPYGVPSLSASDTYYNPKGYWNGPVWVEWDYLIQRGLQAYGYKAEAKELARRVAAGMIAQLKKDHNFWEFYSPDEPWAGYHKTYIWAGLIARMMADASH